MADAWQSLLDDIEAESAVIQGVLAGLDDTAWDRQSPAEGWLLRDCVVHLAETDESATAGVLGEEPQRRGERQGVLTAARRLFAEHARCRALIRLRQVHDTIAQQPALRRALTVPRVVVEAS